MKPSYYKKCLTVSVILLFIGVAFAPSINANVNKQDDLIDFDVELCGLGKKNTVQLTQQEADEVDLLFDDIEQMLSEVETRDEAVEIFKDAIVELDKYGLLGELSVKQAYQLVIGNNVRKHLLNRLDDENNDFLEDENTNYFCFISGYLSHIAAQNILSRIHTRFFYRLIDFLDWANNNGYDKIEDMLSFILYEIYVRITFRQYIFGSLAIYFPFSFLSTLSAGMCVYGPFNQNFYIPSEGHVTSFGLSGTVNWDGELWGIASDILILESFIDFYPAILGFTGIKFTSEEWNTYFLGFALKTSMSSQLPPVETGGLR